MNPSKSFSILFFFLLFINLSGQTEEFDRFNDLMTAVNNLEKNEEYEEAMASVESEIGNWPEFEFELYKEMEYLNGKMSKFSENLKLWNEAHKKGYFFLLNGTMKKFSPYLNFNEFNSLVETDAKLRKKALSISRTKCELIEPKDLVEGKNYPILVILHGGGSSIAKAKQRWLIIPELMNNYFILFVESYRHYDSKSFGWSSKDERGYSEFDSVLTKIITENPIDTTNLIIGGTSAGATFALGFLNSFSRSIKGIIAFCPGKPSILNFLPRYKSTIKIFITAGENDYYLPKQRELTKYFDENMINYNYKIVPEIGHEFPKTYNSEMKEAFQFIN